MKKKLVSASLMMLFMCLFSIKSFAEGTNFSVSIDNTSGQVGEAPDYFDLQLAPNESASLPIAISNETNRVQTYSLAIADAVTNINGIVDYTSSKPSYYDDKRVKVTDLFKKTKMEIDVPARSETHFEIPLKMVNRKFDGELLGGITIKEKESKSKEMIANVFWYTFAIQVRQTDKIIKPSLSYQKMAVEQIDNHNAISMVLNNASQTLISYLTGDFTLTDKKSHKVLSKTTKENMSIAPNNRFSLPIFTEKELLPGVYLYELTLRNEENKWHFKEEINVTSKEAKAFNETSVDQKTAHKDKKGLIIFALIIILLLIWITRELILIRKKRKVTG